MSICKINEKNISPKGMEFIAALILSLKAEFGYYKKSTGNFISINKIINDRYLTSEESTGKNIKKNLGYTSRIIPSLEKYEYITCINKEKKANGKRHYRKDIYTINKEKFYSLFFEYLNDVIIKKEFKKIEKRSYEKLYNLLLEEDKDKSISYTFFQLFKSFISDYINRYVDLRHEEINKKVVDKYSFKSIDKNDSRFELKIVIYHFFMYLGHQFSIFKNDISYNYITRSIVKRLDVKSQKILRALLIRYFLIHEKYELMQIEKIYNRLNSIKNYTFNDAIKFPTYFSNQMTS